MNQLERIYRIHELLINSHYPVSMRRFEEELSCVRNTVTRDFTYLRDFLNAPIVYDRELNGYLYDPNQPVFELPGFWLNASELYALLLCQKLLQEVQPGLMSSRLGPLKQRINYLLEKSGKSSERLEQCLHIRSVHSRRVDDNVFIRIAEATLEGRRISMTYHARGTDERVSRVVSPQQLTHYRHSWYLLAMCHKANDLRLFSLERITEPQVLGEPAQQVPHDDLVRRTFIGFGIFSGESVATAHLIFDAYTARWAAEEVWHEKQEGWWKEKEYHLTLPYVSRTELVMEILRYGSGVKVVAPPELRRDVKEKIKKMYENYWLKEQ